ncbi:MAG: microcin C ABC transporter permease YejB [Campylobacteraceae bacterium]
MLRYILKRLYLVIPTLIGILTINFFVIQLAPGGPVEQYIASMEGSGENYMERVGASSSDFSEEFSFNAKDGSYKGSKGLTPEVIEDIKVMYGFDKPILTRYFTMLKDYLSFNLGDSLFKSGSILGLIKDALPVSISLGIWSTLLIYLISIPLGIARAVKRDSKFDTVTGFFTVVASAIPTFLFAVLLVVLFAGGSYFKWFPLRGLHSLGYEALPFWQQILDYFHHLALPITAMTIGGFATLTLLTRNSFIDELSKQYVESARAKGLSERKVLYGHVFRNAMLIVISGFPSTFIRMFFAGSLLIETIFSLNGLGLLGFEAAMQRDYPLMFGTLYIFTLLGLLTSIISDITLTLVDPRIDFESRRKA